MNLHDIQNVAFLPDIEPKFRQRPARYNTIMSNILFKHCSVTMRPLTIWSKFYNGFIGQHLHTSVMPQRQVVISDRVNWRLNCPFDDEVSID